MTKGLLLTSPNPGFITSLHELQRPTPDMEAVPARDLTDFGQEGILFLRQLGRPADPAVLQFAPPTDTPLGLHADVLLIDVLTLHQQRPGLQFPDNDTLDVTVRNYVDAIRTALNRYESPKASTRALTNAVRNFYGISYTYFLQKNTDRDHHPAGTLDWARQNAAETILYMLGPGGEIQELAADYGVPVLQSNNEPWARQELDRIRSFLRLFRDRIPDFRSAQNESLLQAFREYSQRISDSQTSHTLDRLPKRQWGFTTEFDLPESEHVYRVLGWGDAERWEFQWFMFYLFPQQHPAFDLPGLAEPTPHDVAIGRRRYDIIAENQRLHPVEFHARRYDRLVASGLLG